MTIEPNHTYNIRMPWSLWLRLEAVTRIGGKHTFIVQAVTEKLDREEKR